MKKSILLLVLGLITGLVLATSLLRSCTPEPMATAIKGGTKTDTVYLTKVLTDTIKVIDRVNRYIPQKMMVYQVPDTNRRAALEKDTLFTGLQLKGNRMELQTITPRGISLVMDYKLPESSLHQITIDHKGNLEVIPDSAAIRKLKRRERWRKIGNWGLVVGAFVVGVVITQ